MTYNLKDDGDDDDDNDDIVNKTNVS